MFVQTKEPELTVVITVLAPTGKPFSGLRIKSVTNALDLTLGDEGVFERYLDPHARDKPVFGIAHLREPGTFSTDSIETIETPGLLMFMRLPGILDGVSALKRMVECAGELAHRLGGTLCDERRNKMTNQALIHLRTEVVELERRRRIWAQARRG
jgi:cell division protein ZipA